MNIYFRRAAHSTLRINMFQKMAVCKVRMLFVWIRSFCMACIVNYHVEKKTGDKSPWMLSHIILTSDYNAWWRQQQVSFLKYSVLVYPGQPFIPVPKGVQHGCSYQQATEMECQFEHWHVTTDVTTNFTILCVLNLYFTLFVFTFQSFSTSYRLLFF